MKNGPRGGQGDAHGSRLSGWRAHHCAIPYFFATLLMLCSSGVARASQRGPYVPASPGVILEHVPPTTDPRVRRFDRLQAELKRQPNDPGKQVALARAYIDYGRSTGDARFLGRAMAVIAPSMAWPVPPVAVLLVHATIQQSRHKFDASRAELSAILKRDPENVQAWLTLATVAMVQGDVALANRACVELTNTSGNFMGMVCSASLRSLTGHADQAYTLLSLVEDPGPKAPPEIRAWIEGLMADTAARMGHAADAEQHFKSALQWTPGDNFLLADYGAFLIDQGRPRQAIDLIAGDTRSDTSMLIVVAAESALGTPHAATDVADMDARFRSMDERGDHVFMREQSSYLLHIKHDPRGALALAQQDWKVQRAPKDVRVYLQAALAAHDPVAAKPVLDFLARTGLDDVRINPLAAQLRAMQLAGDPSAARSEGEHHER